MGRANSSPSLAASLARWAVALGATASLAPAAAPAQGAGCVLPPVVLTPTGGVQPEEFGARAALGDDVLLVWDLFQETVTAFERAGGVWSETQVLQGASPGDQFGCSLATDGQTAVVGAFLEGTGGRVHVFEKQGGTWTETALLSPLSEADERFGEAVALDGEVLAATAAGTGHLYIYRRSGSVWSLETRATYSSPSASGAAVSASGDTVFVGQRSGWPIPGYVAEFRWSGSDWVAGAVIGAPSGFHDGFGSALALDGDRLLVGASGSEAVYVFERTGSVWSLADTLTGSPVGLPSFGRSVDLRGDLALVGSPSEQVGGVSVGSARLFEFQAGRWTPVATLYGDTSQASYVGKDVALGPGIYVASTSSFYTGESGRAYVWEEAPAPEVYCTAGTTALGCQPAIGWSGQASASAPAGFDVSVSGAEGGVAGLLFFGTTGRQANPWGNGTSYQCVAPPVQRTGLQVATGTPGQCDGTLALDVNVWMSAHPAKAPAVGVAVQIQAWLRDPQNSSNQTTSLSDALEFHVCQ